MNTRAHIRAAAAGGLFLSWLLVACGDPGSFGSGIVDDATAPDLGAGGPAGDAAPDDAGPADPDARRPRRDAEVEPPVTAVPAYVQMRLDPARTVYARSERPAVIAEVFDRYGDPIPDAPLAWSVVPAPAGAVDAEGGRGTVTFLQEGPGAVRACATPDVCGRATFFVDDGPPVLTLTEPTPGQVIMGRPLIPVTGTVTGGSVDDAVQVFVNDAPVEVDAAGLFHVELPARFGYNRIEVVADDGVQRPSARALREALYAPRFLVPGASSVEIGPALSLRLSQALLDTNTPAADTDGDGLLEAPDLAALLEVLIARLDLLSLLGDPVLAEGEPLALTVESASAGVPEVALLFTDTGLEVFLRLTDLSLDTRGALLLEGERVDLTGRVSVDAAAFARVALVAGPGGEPGLRVESADVALERVSGRMNDSTAQAVLDTFGSLLRTVVEEFARRTVDELIASRVPDFIGLGLGDVLSTVADLPLDVEADGVIPALHLRAGFRLAEPHAEARRALTLTLTGTVRQPSPVQAPYPDPGVADETTAAAEEAGPPWPAAAGAAVAVRMRAVNTVLHELWRQGALRIDVTPVIPENLRALLSEATLDAHLPPLVVAAPPGAPYLFELQAGEIDLFATSARNPAPDRYVLSLRAGLILTAAPEGLRFEIAPGLDIRAALVAAGGERPFLPEDALSDLLSNLAASKLQEAIGNGLEVPVGEIHLGLDTLGALGDAVDGVSDVQLLPAFPLRPRVENGWFTLGATLTSRLR